MSNPTFSIIIPTFNSAQFLKEALESIVKQTYASKEVLIIDGLSTDDTAAIGEKYSANYPYIQFIPGKDSGVYDAMNKGIDLAKGDWLYFLGSDDFLHDEEVLKDVAAAIVPEELDVLYGEVFLTGRRIQFGGLFNVLRLHTVENLCHQSVFYHQSVFEKLGNYNLTYKVNADWDLNIRCFRHPLLRIKHIDRVIAFFNDFNGLSGREYDNNFYEELPLPYIKKLNELKVGKSYRDWLYKAGITQLIKKVFGIRGLNL